MQRDGEARLRLALDTGGLGVWEWDATTDRIEWDHRLEAIFGLADGDGPPDFASYLAMIHPDDRPQVEAIVASASESGDDFEVRHRIVRPDGTIRWIDGRGRPIREGGATVGMIGVTGDITEQMAIIDERDRLFAEESRAREQAQIERDRLEFLIEAKATLSQTLDLTDRLERLTHLSIPRLADGAAVHLLDENGQPSLLALHHRDPSQVELIRDLFDRYPVRLDGPGIGASLREGTSGWLPEVTDEMLVRASRSEAHLALLRSLDLTAGLVVPLLGPDGVFGAITFITVGGRQMSETDLALVEQLCSRIAVLLRNAQLMEARELDRRASRYQAALLQTMIEASVDGILAVGLEGEVLWHNHRFLELWDLDDSLVAQGDDALLSAAEERVADRDDFVESVKTAYVERPEHCHDEVVLANGRVLDRHGSSLCDDDGEYLGFLWSFRDITEDRARTNAIAEAGERAATLSRTLQRSLLPPRLPTIPGVDLAARYHAAGEGIDVGGDFYDVFAVGDDWMVVIGDVCGKGAEAASITALARYTIRAATSHTSDPASILADLNSVMLADGESSDNTRFATVCCIRLRLVPEGIAVAVSCGGHPLPIVVRADGRTEQCGTPGTLLGVFSDVSLSTDTCLLEPGDAIIGFTDGVLEARDPTGQQFEIEGVVRVATELLGRSASELCGAIEGAALSVQGGTAHDDIAILIAQASAT